MSIARRSEGMDSMDGMMSKSREGRAETCRYDEAEDAAYEDLKIHLQEQHGRYIMWLLWVICGMFCLGILMQGITVIMAAHQ